MPQQYSHDNLIIPRKHNNTNNTVPKKEASEPLTTPKLDDTPKPNNKQYSYSKGHRRLKRVRNANATHAKAHGVNRKSSLSIPTGQQIFFTKKIKYDGRGDSLRLESDAWSINGPAT